MNLEFAEPFGCSVMAQFALVATRHMHEFGTTPEQIATCRRRSATTAMSTPRR